MIRRFLPIGGIAVIFSLALGGSAVAGGGGFGSPGQTHREDTTASAFFGGKGGPGPGPGFASINVRQGMVTFEPEEGPATKQQGTFVNLFTSLGSGCFRIPDESFSATLQGGKLDATVGPLPNCPPGQLVSSSTVVNPDADLAGIAGGGGGFSAPVELHLVWTIRGAVVSSTNSSTVSCLDFSSESQFTSRSISATAQGTISVLAGSRTGRGSISQNVSETENSGVPDFKACFGGGF